MYGMVLPMSKNDGLVVFKDVSYEYDATKPILKSADFVIRRGAKLTLMGKNGAGAHHQRILRKMFF
jgi:ATPase subunit of ABC transporter with duplicated ATPase domains